MLCWSPTRGFLRYCRREASIEALLLFGVWWTFKLQSFDPELRILDLAAVNPRPTPQTRGNLSCSRLAVHPFLSRSPNRRNISETHEIIANFCPQRSHSVFAKQSVCPGPCATGDVLWPSWLHFPPMVVSVPPWFTQNDGRSPSPSATIRVARERGCATNGARATTESMPKLHTRAMPHSFPGARSRSLRESSLIGWLQRALGAFDALVRSALDICSTEPGSFAWRRTHHQQRVFAWRRMAAAAKVPADDSRFWSSVCGEQSTRGLQTPFRCRPGVATEPLQLLVGSEFGSLPQIATAVRTTHARADRSVDAAFDAPYTPLP
jgi:hypothetical protein